MGQFVELCVVDEDDEDDGDGEELLVAAFAIADPPPTRTPVRVRAVRALRSRGLMSVHLLPLFRRAPVKTADLGGLWDAAVKVL